MRPWFSLESKDYNRDTIMESPPSVGTGTLSLSLSALGTSQALATVGILRSQRHVQSQLSGDNHR